MLCLCTLSFYFTAKSQPSSNIDDFIKKFQNNISGMEGLKNTFFSQTCKEVINIKTGNIEQVDDYIKSSFFKKLKFLHRKDDFISCKNDGSIFYYVYAFEAKYKKSVTFELTSDFKIRTIITQEHQNLLTPCKNDGGSTPTKNPNVPISPPIVSASPSTTEGRTNPTKPSKKPVITATLPTKQGNRTRTSPMLSDEEKQDNRILKIKIDSCFQQNTNLTNDNQRQQKALTETESKLKISSDSLTLMVSEYQKLYDCIHSFCNTVQIELEEANRAYDIYKRAKEDGKRKVDKVALENFKKAWEIYKKIYGANQKEGVCRLTKKDCLGQNPEACLNMAYTLILNNENVVNELGTNSTEKLNNRTAMTLFNLSLIINNENNPYRAQAIELLAYLPRILFQEKTTTNSGTVALLNEIKQDYDKGDYSSSLSKFDRIYYLLDLDEFKAMNQAVLDAKYSAGMILLWQLADPEIIKPWIIPGSWLYGFERKNPKMGKDLLREVQKNTKDIKLIKQIKYALSKYPD